MNRIPDPVTQCILLMLSYIRDHDAVLNETSDDLRYDTKALRNSLVDFISGYDPEAFGKWLDEDEKP